MNGALQRGEAAEAAACLATVGAPVALLFLVRAELERSLDALRTRLALPATITLEPGVLRVVLAMEDLDIRVRRAGLDFDPGFAPWLNRRVEIVYRPTDGRWEPY